MADSDYLLGYLRQQETLGSAINKFKSAIEPTDRQTTLVSERQNAVRQRLMTYSTFDIEKIVLHGSYARDTQIRPLASETNRFYQNREIIDVDSLLILESSQKNLQKYWYVNDGGTQALRDLWVSLNGYQNTNVQIDRPAVSLNWANMKMEICPAFRAEGGGYLIPSRTDRGSWIHTDPIRDAEVLSEANQIRKSELKPLTKMMKSWNRNWGRILGSFPIETALYHSTRGFTEVPTEIQHVLSKLIEWDGTYLETPSKIGQKVFINILPEKKKIVQQCLTTVSNAIEAANRGDHKTAVSLFGLVFGKPFPGA